jgi:hypothetical protein
MNNKVLICLFIINATCCINFYMSNNQCKWVCTDSSNEVSGSCACEYIDNQDIAIEAVVRFVSRCIDIISIDWITRIIIIHFNAFLALESGSPTH